MFTGQAALGIILCSTVGIGLPMIKRKLKDCCKNKTNTGIACSARRNYHV